MGRGTEQESDAAPLQNFVAIIQDARVVYHPDGDLWGHLELLTTAGSKHYAQFLPQPFETDPPGWASIEALTGISGVAVAQAWDGPHNPVAEQAFAKLRAETENRRLLVRETAGARLEKALVFALLEVRDPDVRIALPEPTLRAAEDEVVGFVQLAGVRTQVDPVNLSAPRFILELETGQAHEILIPDLDHDPDPVDWFLFECVWGFAAIKVARSWEFDSEGRKASSMVEAVRQAFMRTVAAAGLPVTAEGRLSLNALRRDLVRRRAAQGHEPLIFMNRNTKRAVSHAWLLLKDIYGAQLFRYNVERGASSGTPALVRLVDGRQKLEVLDTREKMRGALLHAMDFCSVMKSRDPTHLAPPDVVVQQMIHFADQSVPAVDTLVRIPTMRRDGTVHDVQGYDPRSRVWYAPELEIPPLPEVPTPEETQAALATLIAPFAEFPFVPNSGSLSAVLACLLDQLVRPMVLGPRPIYAFDAPAFQGQGSGKCVTRDALVMTRQGLVPAGLLVPAEVPEDAAVDAPEGLEVLTHRGVFAPVSRVYNGGTKPCLRLTTERGFSVTGTHVHPVRVMSPAGLRWSRLDEVLPGEWVQVMRHGHAEGYDGEVLEAAASLLGMEQQAPVSAVLRSSQRTWAAYLRGLWTLAYRRASNRRAVWTGAPETARAVHVMMLHFGFTASLTEQGTRSTLSLQGEDVASFAAAVRIRWPGTGAMPALGQAESDLIPLPNEWLRVAAGRQPDLPEAVLHILGEVLDESRGPLTREQLTHMTRDWLPSDELTWIRELLAETSMRWDVVQRVEDAGLQPVVDLCVPGDESFVANGIAVHNTLLATTIGAIITGREIEVTGWPEDQKELPKIITTKLLASEPFVIFDNLEGPVRHRDLAACATATTWSSRLLHSNEAPKLPQTATWCLTLNGAKFSRDIARRTLTIKLDAKTSDPHKRSGFRIRHLVPWAIQHRVEMIRAALLLVRAWIVAGKPEDPRLTAGSFEAWQSVVGGVLYHAGVLELPEALAESHRRDVDAQEYAELVTHWASDFGDQPVTAIQLAKLAETYGLFAGVLSRTTNPAWQGRLMSDIVHPMVGHPVHGHMIQRPERRVHGYHVFILNALEPVE